MPLSVRFIIIFFVSLLISACGGVTPGQMAATSGSVSKAGRATVVLSLNRAGKRCPQPSFTIGRKTGNTYEEVAGGILGNTMMGYEYYKAVSLPAGTYHIVQISCRDGNYVTSLGNSKLSPNKFVLVRDSIYLQSLASFTVTQTDKVVNIGYLEMLSFSQLAGITIKPMPPIALQQFQKTKPALASQAITRLMVKG